ncbi:MAG TPA: YihY/virulence factor BrkB family protein [Blastocatellia bacterium]|nr:YihY/virulence factor BrkB family protein [Blastocatellia bacterium]
MSKLQSFLGGLSLRELAVRSWRETTEDDVLSRSAELAYYFLLALFPMLIFLSSLVGFMPGAQEAILNALSRVAPGEAMALVSRTLHDVVKNSSGGLLSFGVLGTLWAASGGVVAVMGTLNVAYDVKEERPFWKIRLYAIGLTIMLALLVVGGTILIMFGDQLSEWLAAQFGSGPAVAVAWSIVNYLIALALLFIGIEMIYYFGPNLRQQWEWITPGAIFAVTAMIIASLLLSLYLRVAPGYSATYGSLGAVIVLMLWLYLLGAVILIGGEINSEIAHAADKPMPQKESAGHPGAAQGVLLQGRQ